LSVIVNLDVNNSCTKFLYWRT